MTKRATPFTNPNIPLFLGYLNSGLSEFYEATKIDDINGIIEYKAPRTGNRYRVKVEQIGGKK